MCLVNDDQFLLEQITNIYANHQALSSLHWHSLTDGTYLAEGLVSLYAHQNHCVCEFDSNLHFLKGTCDCAWYHDYGPCPHIQLVIQFAATQVTLPPCDYENSLQKEWEEQYKHFDERKQQRQLNMQTQSSKSLLEHIRMRHELHLLRDISRISYHVEPQLHEQDGLCVSFRIYGNHKYKYTIRSIPEFLTALNEKKDVMYGKHLHFVHEESAFDIFAQEQIAFMRKYVRHTENLVYVVDSDVKTIKLNGSALDDFYTLYVGKTQGFTLSETKTVVAIALEHKKEYIRCHTESLQKCSFGLKHLYFTNQSEIGLTLQRYQLDDQGIAALFLCRLKARDILIDAADVAMFERYVLAVLRRYCKIEQPQAEARIEIVRSALYGDIDAQGRIFFQIYYYDLSNQRYDGLMDHSLLDMSYEQELIVACLRHYGTDAYANSIIYMDGNTQSTLEFLTERLPQLSSYCDIYISERLKHLGTEQPYHIQIGVHYQGNLLELDISSEEIPQIEWSALLQAYRQKKKFYRLQTGQFLSLISPQLKELDTLLYEVHAPLHELDSGRLRLSMDRMFSLTQCAKQLTYIEVRTDEKVDEYVNDYVQSTKLTLPAHYETILRDYQKEGIAWLCTLRRYGFHGLLADDMGLGKTVQIIAYLESVERSAPSLVICPASLVYNWEEEVHKFAPQLRVCCICGDRAQRAFYLKQYQEYDLLVTSYDYMRRDKTLYAPLLFDTLVLDEAQYIKNQRTHNAISVKQITALHRLALSGTPIENSLAELWSIFDFLMPDYLYPYPEFQRQFELDIVKNGNEVKMQELKRLLAPFILRRHKQAVLQELPQKIETVRLIPFHPHEAKLYHNHLALVHHQLQTLSGDWETQRPQILAWFTRLRQICQDVRLLQASNDEVSSKFAVCLELIEQLRANGQKVLVFSSFVRALALLEKELIQRQISYEKLIGRSSKEERKIAMDRFQRKTVDVFLISLKAGGIGVNLTAAEAVIHLDPWWNISLQNQATDRAYRIGQEKNVQVYQLIMKDSIEERILTLQQRKQTLANDIMEYDSHGIVQFSREELLELVSEQYEQSQSSKNPSWK